MWGPIPVEMLFLLIFCNENSIVSETAVGCAVVPFLSAEDLFSQRVAPSASRDSTDPCVVLRCRAVIFRPDNHW